MATKKWLEQVDSGSAPHVAPVPAVSPALHRTAVLFQLALLAADLLVGAGVIVLTVGLVSDAGWLALNDWLLLSPLLAGWIGMLFWGGYYNLLPPRAPLVWVYQIGYCVIPGSILALAVTFLIHPDFSARRDEYLVATVLAWVALVAVRLVARRVGPRRLVNDRLLILGTTQRARDLVEALANGYNRLGADLIGTIALASEPPPPPMACPVMGALDDCGAVIEREQVNYLVVAAAPPLPNDVVHFAAHCDASGIRVQTMEAAYEELTWRTPIFQTGEAWEASLASVCAGRYAARLKRVGDVVITIMLLPLALALMGVCAVFIKLLSPGPVFYHQERVGKDGVPFKFTKLRTMVVDAEKNTGPVWATQGDPRITRIGELLRKTRLDEVPQLFAVLRGQMSLVGPRPERQHFVDQFRHEIPLYEKRLMVRPGITGWAQIHHNYDRCRDDVIEKLRYDLYYIRNLCFRLDAQIIVRTIGVMLGKRGAH